ncbi:nucleotidyltransferase domain-containing protein [Ectothiorhodospiraceae bacterium BW-2]|nr:nucleotidyltransferase domain-containing protein [Ectothiorhodospiraceae bacterium BW-2]
MIDLRPKDRAAIIALAQQTLSEQREIWAYGSRVKGTGHDSSDLDLVIKSPADSPLTLDELVTFKQQLHDSTIPILVQVFDWNHIPPQFRVAINQAEELLYRQ